MHVQLWYSIIGREQEGPKIRLEGRMQPQKGKENRSLIMGAEGEFARLSKSSRSDNNPRASFFPANTYIFGAKEVSSPKPDLEHKKLQ